MTDQIVIFAMKQSTWGQRRPMQWVPLELQLSNMRMRKHNILTKDDISKVNKLNEDLALNESQLEDFLNVQHSLGKLIYYPLPLLDNFVIIYPPALVNILRSFVTCTQFFPEKENLKSILHNLTVTGKIYKTDLFKLWNQDQFQQYMPNDATKEFIVQLLIHLDILIIPKTFKHTDCSNELYLVPCMIKESRPVNVFPVYNQGDKTIFLRYSLISGSIPSALTYKVIGAVLSVWPLKEENDRPCLYHKAAVLNVVEDNELRVWVDNNQILVQMTNAQSLQDMSKDVAASIQECLTWNLESCIEFYSSSFGRKIKLTDVSKLYSLEVGIPHHTDVCFISVTKVKDTDTWVCKQGCEHSTRYLRYWIFNRSQDKCEAGCTGLSKDELESEPNEKHLVRLGSTFGIEKFKDYYSKLGMDATTFENIEYDFKTHGSQGIISVAMIKWKTSQPLANKTPTMNDLFNALGDSDTTHRMCKVRI
ncbi:Hypothetical predicted protein [Mytilus galloprovincialis]|uniref:C-terminal of Roc (COR) domain-containing protein n=1 Tax=Mytilus galloprovincialis TaxID=29158 RepID=A0A8B6C5J2_MYTGA|nr:Hypothetical predicted protein [Mytilus galloprovincialis]